MEKITPEPEVILVNYFEKPYDNAIAAARTCYSSKVILPEDVSKDEKSRQMRDRIFESIYQAKHHTTIQHPTFQFVLKKVSRQFVWSFLHSHPFYNSEQVSQRYVEVKPENFLVPSLADKEEKIYTDTIKKQMAGYFALMELIEKDITDEYFRIYPGRKSSPDKWESAIHKKVIEAARYCLPVATHTHLYHTISGITLHRYNRLANQFDTPLEARIVVKKMVEEVNRIDPLFMDKAEDPMLLEETPEYNLFSKFHSGSSHNNNFIKEFDAELGTLRSKLIDYKLNGEATMAQAVRSVLGVTKNKLSDKEAIELVMNPASNRYLSGELTVTTLSKLSRSMFHPHFTFKKKLSHTADSQDQRHRMAPGSRPIMMAHYISDKPDCVIPKVIEQNEKAMEYFSKLMKDVWGGINSLLSGGVSIEYAQYLIPNAFPIRFEESGDLLNLHHKWTTRLCYLAQEEIWRSCLEEVQQVKNIYPTIGKYLVAPCGIRKFADVSSYCPEGSRYCGVPVWELEVDKYNRTI